ncbi:hypothetical protein GQ42DRAFT_54398 [Ramicandelaber brevisporus]|nr:hypothetical protein GQ42DRAFT_54398 [Ramicandelaber brevisporus]
MPHSGMTRNQATVQQEQQEQQIRQAQQMHRIRQAQQYARCRFGWRCGFLIGLLVGLLATLYLLADRLTEVSSHFVTLSLRCFVQFHACYPPRDTLSSRWLEPFQPQYIE